MNHLAGERMALIEDTDVFCPYRGSECEAEWVDLGIDMVQAGPFCCPSCQASEIGGFAADETYSEQKLRTGWHEPVRENEVSTPMLSLHDEEGRDEITPRAREKGRKGWQDMLRPQWLTDRISLGGSMP